MRAHQIMSRQVITVGVDTPVAEAINTMLAHHVSCLPVVDSAGKLAGILSEGDFIRRAEIGTEQQRGRWLTFLAGADRIALEFKRQHGRKVGQIMTPNPVTITEDASLEEIVRLMESKTVKRLPVMRGDELVGIVTHTDFLPAVAKLARNPEGYSANEETIRSAVVAAITPAPWRPQGLNVSVSDGVVSLRGVVGGDNARQAAIVAAENVPGVKRVEDLLSRRADYPASEEDYGGGDFVSLQEQPSTTDDEPL